MLSSGLFLPLPLALQNIPHVTLFPLFSQPAAPALPKPCPRRPQAADNFSFFLEKENELENVREEGRASGSSATLGDHNSQSPRLPAAIAPGIGVQREGGNSPASRKEEEGQREEEQEERRKRRAHSPAAAEWAGSTLAAPVDSGHVDMGIGSYGDIDSGGGGAGRNSLDDVTRPMSAREAEPDSSGIVADDVGRGLSGIFQQKKGPTLLEDRGD